MQRTFGLEIEAHGATHEELAAALRAAGIDCQAMGYTHSTTACWKVVSDGSLGDYTRGFELVSPPLAGEEGYRQIRVVCEVLNRLGCTVNKNCGLHVHHDARDLSLTAWKNLTRLYVKYEQQIDAVMPVSRRANNGMYIRSMLSRHGSVDATFEAIKSATTLERLREVMGQGGRDPRGGGRYHKLNMLSFLMHGTVEFRQHSGTIEADKMINWVKLTADMVACAVTAKTVNAKGGDKFDNLFTLNADYRVNRELKAFYTARRAQLAGRA